MRLKTIFPRVFMLYKNRKLNKDWHTLEYILSNADKFTIAYKNKYTDVREIEHQLGRYFNMKLIAEEIMQSDISGDVVEFGTWQGLGLILLKQLFGDRKMKYIGIDSFEGLPVDSNFWKKGMFNNTSTELVHNNIRKYGNGLKNQVHLIKGWFSDKKVKNDLNQTTNDVVLVHFDADLGSSTTEALTLIETYLTFRKKSIYFLFDDWGLHPDEVPDAFLNWVEMKRPIFNFQLAKLSSTRYTRYYRLDFN